MLETVLMRALRGSGPSGLGAMPVSRGRILRPLITLSRQDVIGYLAEKGITWREDSTNTNVQFLRNRIRHHLIPNLDEHFPQWRGGIAAMGETQSLAAEFIRSEAIGRIKWGVGGPSDFAVTAAFSGPTPCNICSKDTLNVSCALSGGSGEKHSLYTDVENFFAQPAIIREEALFQGINKLGFPTKIKRKNIRSFAKGKLTAVDLGSLQIRRDSQRVMIIAALEMGTGDWGSGIRDRYSDYNFSPELYSNSSNNNPQSLIPSPRSPEKGFSLLINTLGSYNIKGIAIEVGEPINGYVGERAFLAVLPLVLRPYFSDDRIVNERKLTPPKGGFPGQISDPAVVTATAVLTAEDTLGPVAFIGINGRRCQLLRRRDDNIVIQPVPFDENKRCVVRVTIKVNGGIDV
jgi:tRNA(Ile)-lysidine synthase